MRDRNPLYAVAIIGAKDMGALIEMGWKPSPYQPDICWEFVERLPYPAKKLARMIRDATESDAVHVYRGRGTRGRLIARAERANPVGHGSGTAQGGNTSDN